MPYQYYAYSGGSWYGGGWAMGRVAALVPMQSCTGGLPVNNNSFNSYDLILFLGVSHKQFDSVDGGENEIRPADERGKG